MKTSKLAYISYYLKYKDKIYSYFWYRTGMRRELAEDLTSEVFLKAWHKFDQFDRDRSFQAWIYKISHNHLVDHYKQKHWEVEISENASYSDDDKKSWELWQMLVKLPSDDREILSLKYLQGFSYREIAEVLQKTEGAVRVMSHRAIKRLQELNSYDAIR